jgi:hypothetical protein
MCYTRVAAAVVALRKRVCLCVPSVTVCTVVCVRFMTGVRHPGRSAELWRFSTSTRGWGRVDSTSTNGTRPSGRDGHVMTSVGMDLWLHGGYSSYYSDELWRFSTSTCGWERVDSTSDNGVRPSGRTNHVMTSVGVDLWLHGGYGNKGDTCGTHVVPKP